MVNNVYTQTKEREIEWNHYYMEDPQPPYFTNLKKKTWYQIL
jgi:hypothetical protein